MDDRYLAHLPSPQASAESIRSERWLWRDTDVHLERVGRADAAIRVVFFHGAGGNAAAMRPFALLLAALDAEVVVPDLPGYGLTDVPDPSRVSYPMWQELAADLLRRESDRRPLVVVGASVGGMLAYDAAAATGGASAIVVTCLLDPSDAAVRARLSWHPLLGAIAVPVLRVLAGPLARLRLPIRWIANMSAISNDPALVRTVLRDGRGGGGRMPLGWMRSYLESRPAIEPERFTSCPVLLLHPEEDRWTPVSVSMPFFNRLAAPKQLVLLKGAGHIPIEQPGMAQLVAAVEALFQSLR